MVARPGHLNLSTPVSLLQLSWQPPLKVGCYNAVCVHDGSPKGPWQAGVSQRQGVSEHNTVHTPNRVRLQLCVDCVRTTVHQHCLVPHLEVAVAQQHSCPATVRHASSQPVVALANLCRHQRLSAGSTSTQLQRAAVSALPAAAVYHPANHRRIENGHRMHARRLAPLVPSKQTSS